MTSAWRSFLRKLRQTDPVLGLELGGRLPDRRVDLLAAFHVETPHVQVHRFVHADVLLEQTLVIRWCQGQRMIGGCSWPAIRTPISSLVVKSIGPTMRSRPRSRSQPSAASSSARAASASSSHSNHPNKPHSLSWKLLKFSSMWALMRPTGRPARYARKYCASACLKNGFLPWSSRFFSSILSGATQLGSSR